MGEKKLLNVRGNKIMLNNNSVHNEIKEMILKRLNNFAENEELLVKDLSKKYDTFYSELLKILTYIDMSEQEAKNHWKNIVKHKNEMEKKLNRYVGIRVAMHDYLTNKVKILINPKLIEMHFYEITANLAMIDELTWLYNRRFFNHAIELEFKRSIRHKYNLSLFFFDLDDFKQINDTFGHQVGDEVLKTVSKTIMRNSRAEDLACRYGGEEFAIILPETNEKGAFIHADRIRADIETTDIPGCGRNVTISGGIATYPANTNDTKTLIKLSDTAMYAAKNAGKNRIVNYSEQLIL